MATIVKADKQVELDGLDIRYFEEGAGIPAILIHGAGLGSSAEVWLRNMGALASAGIRAIAFDQPGYGESDNPADYSLAYRRDTVLRLMDALGIDRAALVGQSQGARTRSGWPSIAPTGCPR